MINEKVIFNEKYPHLKMSQYIHDEACDPRPAVVVFPGGGYTVLAPQEAEPVAQFYYDQGMNAFVLYYSVDDKAADHAPFIEAALAIKYLRENAEAHNTHPDKIVTCGFSAGGHLSGASGIFWNLPQIRDAVGVTDGSAPEGINRPNGMIMSYPVVSGIHYPLVDCFVKICGGDTSKEKMGSFSLERFVDETTPPVFIWHSFTDTIVNIRHSQLLINAFLEKNVPFEAHIYPTGYHGCALATSTTASKPNPHVATWGPLSVMWIKDIL